MVGHCESDTHKIVYTSMLKATRREGSQKLLTY
ncbi:hypothetical protein H4F52_15605 [Pectobacterium brasiliense]|nr:hypothetical protein [Pectobacterium brasiliense]